MKKATSLRSRWSRASGTNVLLALLTFVLITGSALYGVVTGATLYGAVPDPVPASAPPTEFSSERALEHVRVIAREPHPMGSPANAAVRDYLVEELSALGVEPEVQKTTAAHYLFWRFRRGRHAGERARAPGGHERWRQGLPADGPLRLGVDRSRRRRRRGGGGGDARDPARLEGGAAAEERRDLPLHRRRRARVAGRARLRGQPPLGRRRRGGAQP